MGVAEPGGDLWALAPPTSKSTPTGGCDGACASGASCSPMGHTTFGARGRSAVSRAVGAGWGRHSQGSAAHSRPACPPSLVAFHPDPTTPAALPRRPQTPASRVVLQEDGPCLAVLTAHYSAITSLTFSAAALHAQVRAPSPALAGKEAIATARALRRCPPSPGRDRSWVVWDLRSLQATRTVPVFEVGCQGQ